MNKNNKVKFSLRIGPIATILLLLYIVTSFAIITTIIKADLVPKSIYWGANISGDTYNLADPPWNVSAIDAFESHTHKKLAILHWGQPWWYCHSSCGYQSFQYQVAQYDMARRRGYIPLIDWASWYSSANPIANQPQFSLKTIIDGEHDDYITQWALDAKDWGHPFFLRFNWEMNGAWYPWSEMQNGNTPGQFVRAWRHVHDIFADVGATNVTWVWCPATVHQGAIYLEGLYPGDAYVDWTCMDGYNWGTNAAKPDKWNSFYEVFRPTYNRMLHIAPDKPIMIAEVSSTEAGGSKADWIRDAFEIQLPVYFSRVQAVVWFNRNTDDMDWVIESSPASQKAFARAIGSRYYAENNFGDLDISPIPPLETLKCSLLCGYRDKWSSRGS